MKFIFTLLLALISGISYAESLICNSAGNVKELIIDERYDDLADTIHFPIQALIGGSQVTVSDRVMLKALSKSIFTPSFITFIQNIDNCGLAKKLSIGQDYKVASLTVPQNENDIRYSKSGISSEKELNKFFENIEEYIATKNHSALSELFKYPFYIEANGQKIKIESKHAFLKYQSCIVTSPFLELIKKVSVTKDFIPHTNGLMLNKKGDYWIVEIYGQLYLQAVEPFYK